MKCIPAICDTLAEHAHRADDDAVKISALARATRKALLPLDPGDGEDQGLATSIV